LGAMKLLMQADCQLWSLVRLCPDYSTETHRILLDTHSQRMHCTGCIGTNREMLPWS
jgi:hypothetical protein